MTIDAEPDTPLTEDQAEWLRTRIRQLRSRQQGVGPFRAAGIQRTIAGMKKQISDRIWRPSQKAA